MLDPAGIDVFAASTQVRGEPQFEISVLPERRREAPKSKVNAAALRLRGLWALRSARTDNPKFLIEALPPSAHDMRPMPTDLVRRIPAVSYLAAAFALLLVMTLHLLPALIAGLLVYVLVDALAPLLEQRLSGALARQLLVGALAALIAGLVALDRKSVV